MPLCVRGGWGEGRWRRKKTDDAASSHVLVSRIKLSVNLRVKWMKTVDLQKRGNQSDNPREKGFAE